MKTRPFAAAATPIILGLMACSSQTPTPSDSYIAGPTEGADAGPPSLEILKTGSGAAWSVTVLRGELLDAFDACTADAEIESGLVSADLPSSHRTFTLRAEATEDDALRVGTCMKEAISSGQVTIEPPQ